MAAISAPVKLDMSVNLDGGVVVNVVLHTLHTFDRVSSSQYAGCVGDCTTHMRCHRNRQFA